MCRIQNNKLTCFGVALTMLYILIGCFYFLPKSSAPLPLNEIGDFLAGFCAPLAFLWLVIGYFQNSQTIKLQSEELKHSVTNVCLTDVTMVQ